MATPVEALTQEVCAFTQRINNIELNVLPELTNRSQTAFNRIDAAAAVQIQGLKDNLDEAKRNVDAYANQQDVKWNLAHNDLTTRFAEYEVQFQEAQTKFAILADLLTECAEGSFADFKIKFLGYGQQHEQMKHQSNMLKVDIEQVKDMLKQGMKMVNDRVEDALVTHMSLKDDIDLLTKDGDKLQEVLKGLKNHSKVERKNIMEHRAISNLEKLSGDKRQYTLWLEKFKSAFDQVDEGTVRAVLNILENNMEMLKPKVEGNWNEEVTSKVSELNIMGPELDLIRRQLYAVLIDKVNGDMIIDIKNAQRDGLLSFL
jgi:hypothetical protein